MIGIIILVSLAVGLVVALLVYALTPPKTRWTETDGIGCPRCGWYPAIEERSVNHVRVRCPNCHLFQIIQRER